MVSWPSLQYLDDTFPKEIHLIGDGLKRPMLTRKPPLQSSDKNTFDTPFFRSPNDVRHTFTIHTDLLITH